MFRMLKLKPPNGWNAVAWELAIVTLGVILALAAQQWSENRDWNNKVRAAKDALRNEVAQHYAHAAEWRVIHPCAVAQIQSLQERASRIGAQLEPAPVYSEEGFRYVLRAPSKYYPRSAWEAAIADGVSARLAPSFRQQLNEHYAKVATIAAMSRSNDEDIQSILIFGRTIPLNATARFQLSQTLDRLVGRFEYIDSLSGQTMDHIERLDMVPPPGTVRHNLVRFGSFRFCKAQALPVRSITEALKSIPN